MREIKFRAWDKIYKRFEDDKNIFINQCGGVYCDENCGWYIDRYDMQMFTGLKDKNGKEIYEGDIVTSGNGATQIVYYSNIYAAFLCEDISRPVGELGATWIVEVGDEVIGNIYNNPELLKMEGE